MEEGKEEFEEANDGGDNSIYRVGSRSATVTEDVG
jgi:hypothetical protein